MTPLVVISSAKKKMKKQPVRIRAMTWVHPYLMDGCIFDIAPFQIRATTNSPGSNSLLDRK